MRVREIDPAKRVCEFGYTISFVDCEDPGEIPEKILIINPDGTTSEDFYHEYEIFLPRRKFWIAFSDALDKKFLKLFNTHFSES